MTTITKLRLFILVSTEKKPFFELQEEHAVNFVEILSTKVMINPYIKHYLYSFNVLNPYPYKSSIILVGHLQTVHPDSDILEHAVRSRSPLLTYRLIYKD